MWYMCATACRPQSHPGGQFTEVVIAVDFVVPIETEESMPAVAISPLGTSQPLLFQGLSLRTVGAYKLSPRLPPTVTVMDTEKVLPSEMVQPIMFKRQFRVP